MKIRKLEESDMTMNLEVGMKKKSAYNRKQNK